MKYSRAFRSLFILLVLIGIAIIATTMQRPTAVSEEETGGNTTDQNSATELELAQQAELEKLAKGPKTAEELLEKLDSDHSWFTFSKGELPDEEIEKAAKALRERYPLESVRERVNRLRHREADKPEKAREQIDQQEVKHLNFLWDLRTQALVKLHSDEVGAFINRSQNGFSRMPSTSPYNLRDRQIFVEKLEPVPVSSDVLRERTVRLTRIERDTKSPVAYARIASLTKSGMPTLDLTEHFHQQFSYNFIAPGNLGYFKSIDQVAGFNAHNMKQYSDWNGLLRPVPKEDLRKYEPQPNGLDISWRANRLQLVSLLLHDEPSVYVSENLPDMEELSGVDVEVRSLNKFEDNSLAELFEGEEVVTHATANRIEMLGAIRATNNCLQCHDVKEKTLLGAFSYEFLRDPMVDVSSIDQFGMHKPQR